MPCLKVFTNLQRSKIPNNFVVKLIPVLAKCVKKPAEKFIVSVAPDCSQCFGDDSTSPSIVATLESIGNLGPSENQLIVKEITEFIEKELGVQRERIFISLYDLQAHNIGKNGVTMG